MVDLIVSRGYDHSTELTSLLECLPSYKILMQNSDKSDVFDAKQESSSGLISFIRRGSQTEQTTINSSDAVRFSLNIF